MIRKTLPVFEGEGQVRFLGHEGPVHYAISGDPKTLRAGTARLRGSLRLDEEVAVQAFRAGEGALTLADGAVFRIVMTAHSAGRPEVYVELKI